jgi:N6-L-threonylcarbamoyladenine synthase
MIVLTLESSCDETSAAIVEDGHKLRSNVVASQVDVHSRFGGVVPEVASRQHVEAISMVIAEALRQAELSLDDIEGIGVTAGPGLIGALLVGISVGEAIAYARQIPLVGLHHMEGHILSPMLEQEIAFPFLALAVSGGHTHLYRVDAVGHYTTLGQTRDDAAGEAFDKVAKMAGLGYPGGSKIDQLATKGDPGAIIFPRPMLHRGLDFSFSGIKTAVRNHIVADPESIQPDRLPDLAAGFQAAVVEVLTKKTFKAAAEQGLERIVVCGGVACNSGLRSAMQQQATKKGVQVIFPSPALCGDNAAMLGVAADVYLSTQVGSRQIRARASWPLDAVTRDRVTGSL